MCHLMSGAFTSTALEPCDLSGGTIRYQPASARAVEKRSLINSSVAQEHCKAEKGGIEYDLRPKGCGSYSPRSRALVDATFFRLNLQFNVRARSRARTARGLLKIVHQSFDARLIAPRGNVLRRFAQPSLDSEIRLPIVRLTTNSGKTARSDQIATATTIRNEASVHTSSEITIRCGSFVPSKRSTAS